MVKSITLQMSQSASVLQEQPSSHFFRSSHNLKFLNCLSSFFTKLKSSTMSSTFFSLCYPFCHMNTSLKLGLSALISSSSSKVTIFSFCLEITLLGTLTVSGRKFPAAEASSVVMDRSNSLMLLGTKYSIRGSAPEKWKFSEIVQHIQQKFKMMKFRNFQKMMLNWNKT